MRHSKKEKNNFKGENINLEQIVCANVIGLDLISGTAYTTLGRQPERD